MIRGLVVSNGIGSEKAYRDRDDIRFDVAEIGPDFELRLEGYDLLIAPNGTDHVALYRHRRQIRDFLDAGNSLFCFCGWFLDWIPGNRWVHDNSKATRDVRHIRGSDPLGLLEGVDLAGIDHNRHGISGWWACGIIEAAPGANVLIRDPWNRALAVCDTITTPGLMFLTASGPVGDYSSLGYGESPLCQMYENGLRVVGNRLHDARTQDLVS